MKILFHHLILLITINFCTNAQNFWNQTTTAHFNTNSNFNINAQNDEIRLSSELGNGTDGYLYIPPGGMAKTDSIKTSVTGNNPSGQNAIQVNSSTGFLIGDEILIITMQDNNSDLINNVNGQFEFFRVINKTSTALILDKNLSKNYNSTGKKHQILKVPNYDSVKIDIGGTLTCNDWDGNTGGILAFRSKGLVNILALGKIDASGKGYRGGASVIGTFMRGIQGEGMLGIGTTNHINNANGGGGGYVGNYYQLAGGGGGGHGDSGRVGQVCGYMSFGGKGGAIIGDMFLTKFQFGGGGGSGSTDGYTSGTTGKGGDGGGIIYITTDSIKIGGFVLANGEFGENYLAGAYAGGGGGGGGGMIYIISNKVINLGNNFVNAIGGIGGIGTAPDCNNGGLGGFGRLRIDAPSTIGTSSPAVGYEGITYANIGTSTTPFIIKPPSVFWGNIIYTKDISTPGTSIVIDVLNQSNSVLLSNVNSGLNLNWAGISQTIDTIKLRAKLLNIYGNQTPVLFDWSIDTALTDINDWTLLPQEFFISQNYPNPFNPTTIIKYALPQAENVNIKVYDILGREVAVLVDEYRNAGYYSTNFNASQLASGIYLYRIRAGSFVSTKKMMVVK